MRVAQGEGRTVQRARAGLRVAIAAQKRRREACLSLTTPDCEQLTDCTPAAHAETHLRCVLWSLNMRGTPPPVGDRALCDWQGPLVLFPAYLAGGTVRYVSHLAS